MFINISGSVRVVSWLWCDRATYVKVAPGESVNDRNDRAIRVAAAWYAKLLPQTPILLITNDADNLRKAKLEGLNAMNVQVRVLIWTGTQVHWASQSMLHVTCFQDEAYFQEG